jgi:hypothetical protein
MGALRNLRERTAAHLAAERRKSKAKIAAFAKEYGFKLVYYKLGLCAIFEKGLNGK